MTIHKKLEIKTKNSDNWTTVGLKNLLIEIYDLLKQDNVEIRVKDE